MHDIVDVEPQVVILGDVTGETTLGVLVEGKAIKTADEANVCHVLVAGLLLVTKLGKGVDNNTEQDVHDDDLNDDEEAQVGRKLYPVELEVFTVVNLLSNITDTTSLQHSVTRHTHKALQHCAACVFPDLSRIITVKRSINDSVLHVKEWNCRENIDSDSHQ